MPTTHLIAMGGGGFSMDDARLDQYIIEQAPVSQPKICFLPQAGAEDDFYIVRFYRAFLDLGCAPSHLSLFRPHTADIVDFLLSQDVIYVGGGNTKSLLALWREWELDAILRRAWQQGTMLAGVSAGAICWFEQGLTDSIHNQLNPLPCLGYLTGSCAPHYDGEEQRRPRFHELVASGEMPPGYGIDDYAALHFVDGELHRVVASREGAQAYRVECGVEGAAETPLTARPLS